MAARAQARAAARELEAEEPDEHDGHHQHLRGTMVECSCGEELGITCVALPPLETEEEKREFWDSLACRECGKKGVSGPMGVEEP